MKVEDALWTAKQVSEYLNVGERQVRSAGCLRLVWWTSQS